MDKRFVNLKSPIFWRIATGVFVSILLIEAALLLFSWYTERGRQLSAIEDSISAVTTLINQQNPTPQLNQLIQIQSEDSKYQIIGYVYESPAGTRHAGGESLGLDEAVNSQVTSLYSSAEGIYSTYRNIGAPDAGKLWLKLDASWVNVYMDRYIWRILGMIVLISLFVTAGCLVFMQPLLIKPLQRLNRLLVQAERHGIDNIHAESKDLSRRDELGNVFRSYNHWKNELIVSQKDRAYMSERFEEFANLGADCFWEVDNKQVFTYFTGDTMPLLFTTPDEIVGRSCRSLLNEISDRLPDGRNMLRALHREGVWEGEILPLSSKEPTRTVRVAAIAFREPNSDIAGFRGTIVDISEETALRATLKYQATHDELTGLCNRRELTSQISESIESFHAQDAIFTLLTIDVDRFKAINDSCGHVAGDMLLQTLADRMQAPVSADDTVARIGGDEFSILLRNSDSSDALHVAEQIRSSIEEYQFLWEGQSFSVSVSIGLAEVSTELSTLESVVFASDTCCITAKSSGRNQIRSYSPDDDTVALCLDEALWISRINAGIEHNTFRLFQQSIVRIDKKEEEHFEILLRLQDDSGGYWPPNLFLPVAERNELMPKIDAWVVSNALHWLKHETISDEVAYCMNINLSAASLANTEFQTFLLNIVEQNGELNKYVCLEITESAAMVNPENTIALLKKLREYGCTVALDDFGTGFSSLSQIQTLPLDYIKIDGAFIQEIHSNELDQALVKSIAEIAKVLKIKTVAEFVDSEAALSVLDKLDIDYAQGYLISKPEALDFSAVKAASQKAA